MKFKIVLLLTLFHSISFHSILMAELIDLNFKNLTLNQLIQISSKVLKKDILSSHSIKGSVDFSSIGKVSKDRLFDILKQSLNDRGYHIKKQKNYYKISKYDKHYNELIKINNAKAVDILKALERLGYKKVQKSLMEDINVIILQGDYKRVQEIKQLISKMDQKRVQVYIKAKIIELNNQKVNSVGVKYGLFKSKSTGSELYTFATTLNGYHSGGELFNFQTPFLSLSSAKSVLALGATLSLLNENQALSVISEPSILCLNNEASSIYVGESKSIKSTSSTSEAGLVKELFVREQIGLTLRVKPRILENNRVLLQLQTSLENFSLTGTTNNQPDTFKKEIQNQVIALNGESVIIGGLFENRKESTQQRVPFISQIPLLGELFKNSNEFDARKNLVMIITPYIINEQNSLTKLNEHLAQLDMMQEKYLSKVLKEVKKEKKHSIEEDKYQNLHEQRVRELFNGGSF